MYVKWGFSALAIVPYARAAPDWAIVLPRRIELLVMPTSLWAAGALEPPQAAMVTRKATSTPRRGPIFAIEAPPVFLFTYLNSLGVGRHLSTSPITSPAEPRLQAGISHRAPAARPPG